MGGVLRHFCRRSSQADASRGPSARLLKSIIPWTEQGKGQPDYYDQRRACPDEITEGIMAWPHDEQVGLIADRGGEGAVGCEDRGGDESHWRRADRLGYADADRGEEDRRSVV